MKLDGTGHGPAAADQELRVAYALTFDPSRLMGLWAKLQERLSLWSEQGVAVDVAVCVRPDSPLVEATLPAPHRLHTLTARRSFLATRHLRRWVRGLQPDIVYARYSLPWPGLASLAQSAPLILEVHADETLEREWQPWSFKMLSLIGSSHVLRKASGFVFIDPTLCNSGHLNRFGARRLVLPNGVLLDGSVSYGRMRDRVPGPPRLVLSVGVPDRWHGLDKFEDLAGRCPDLEFHVLGCDAPPGDPGRVIYHGQLSVSEHDAAIRRMDIGVGNLGLERIDRPAASPLKVRDYIRAGLPVILAHHDPDLPMSDDSVLDVGYGFTVTQAVAQRLNNFATAQMGRACSQGLARSVDAKAKERRRISFMREIASAWKVNRIR